MSAAISSPRVSVIVPVYNRAAAVRAAAASVLGQTYRDFELILVDDGSTDGSGAVADELAAAHPSLARAVHQPNAGAAAARNRGIALSRGEYICFLDSDDEWLPEKLAVQVESMDRHPEVALSYVWALIVDSQGSTLGQMASKAGRNTYRKLFYLNPIAPTSGTMVRAGVLREVGVFDTDLRTREDLDLWLRIAARFGVAEVPKILVRWRSGEGSLSRDLIQCEEDHFRVLRRAIERDREKGGTVWRREKRVLAHANLRYAHAYLRAGDYARFRDRFRTMLRTSPWVAARHPRATARCLLAMMTARP